MPSFGTRLAGAFAQPVGDALLNYQFYNPLAPNDIQNLSGLFGSFLSKGAMRFQDESGSASLNPLTGEFELMGKNFGVGINPNQFDPSAQIKFQFGKNQSTMFGPQMMNEFLQGDIKQQAVSPARQELENQLEQYRFNNPTWYRP